MTHRCSNGVEIARLPWLPPSTMPMAGARHVPCAATLRIEAIATLSRAGRDARRAGLLMHAQAFHNKAAELRGRR